MTKPRFIVSECGCGGFWVHWPGRYSAGHYSNMPKVICERLADEWNGAAEEAERRWGTATPAGTVEVMMEKSNKQGG